MVEAVDPRLAGAIEHKVGHDWTRCCVKGCPVPVGSDHFTRDLASQYFAGAVPVGDPMLGIDHQCRHRGALDDLIMKGCRVPQCCLGLPPTGDILQGFDGPDDLAVGIADGSRCKVKPAPTLAEGGEEIFGLPGTVNQRRRTKLAFIEGGHRRLNRLINDQISEYGSRLVIKGTPLGVRADHFGSGHTGQLGAGTIPVGNMVAGIDDNGRDRIAFDQLRQIQPGFRKKWCHGNPVRLCQVKLFSRNIAYSRATDNPDCPPP